MLTIGGRGAERDVAWTAYRSRRRPNRPVHQRPGFRPDRAALWAVVLGLLLVLVAATSGHAATTSPATTSSRAATAPLAATVRLATPAVGIANARGASKPSAALILRPRPRA